MVREDRGQLSGNLWVKGASLLAVLAGVLLLTSSGKRSGHNLQALAPPAESKTSSSQLLGKGDIKPFRDWPPQPPDVALVLTGQMHGYHNPCGCSRPQLGGLERRYNFIQQLKNDKNWEVVVPIDLGDVFEDRSRRKPQYLPKYRWSMLAMDKIGYQAVGLGLHEMELPLLTALAEYALNNPTPQVVGTNLQNAKLHFPEMVQPWSITEAAPKVGIASIVGPTVAKDVPQNQKPAVQFVPTLEALPQVLKEFDKAKVEIRVLLYQGTLDEAKACASRFPQLDVIVIPTKEEEPDGKPVKVGDTLIVGTGHKGRYVGVVGCFKSVDPKRQFDLRYQLVAMTEDYETPQAEQHQHPILELLDQYAKEVARDNYLSRYPKTKHPIQLAFPQAKYVGSSQCKRCHKEAYDVWKDSNHAHAFATLEQSTKRPILRHVDGECVSCHVVGFNHETGYEHQFTYTNDTLTTIKETVHLRDVGCESCHGPGSAHIKNTNNTQLHDLMNPFRYVENETPAARQRRHNLIDRSCQQCHDQDNDVHWDFSVRWPNIVHPEKDRKNPF